MVKHLVTGDLDMEFVNNLAYDVARKTHVLERVENLEEVDPKDYTSGDKDMLDKVENVHRGEHQLVMKSLM